MEWYRSGHNEHDWKSCDGQKPSEGSNPSHSAKKKRHAYACLFFGRSAVCCADRVACGRELNAKETPDGFLSNYLPFRKRKSSCSSIASVDKGTHARRAHRPAFRCVIVLDIRRYACVLCLAKNAPERPAGLRVFPEHGRQMARQTRQMGCRPSTRITQPAAVQAWENHVCSCQLTLV